MPRAWSWNSTTETHLVFILTKEIYFSGVLRELDAPGHFEQQLYFYGIPMPSVDYNVIYIDEEVHTDPEFKNSRLIIFN